MIVRQSPCRRMSRIRGSMMRLLLGGRVLPVALVQLTLFSWFCRLTLDLINGWPDLVIAAEGRRLARYWFSVIDIDLSLLSLIHLSIWLSLVWVGRFIGHRLVSNAATIQLKRLMPKHVKQDVRSTQAPPSRNDSNREWGAVVDQESKRLGLLTRGGWFIYR